MTQIPTQRMMARRSLKLSMELTSAPLLALFESTRQVLRQVRAQLETLHRAFDVVLEALEPHVAVLQDHVRSPPIPIPGLPDGADVDDHPPGEAFLAEDVVDRLRFEKPVGLILREDARIVGVPREADPPGNLGRRGEDLVHLLAVLPVLVKDVFAGGITGRAMHVEIIAFDVLLGQAADEIPQVAVLLDRFARETQLLPRPVDRGLGLGIEADGAEEDRLLMVPEEIDRK